MKISDLKLKVRALQKQAGIDMNVRAAWKVQKNLSALEKDYTIAENMRNDIIKKYGVEKNGIVVIEDEDKKLIATNEINQLEETDIEGTIEFIPITLDELGDIKISPADIFVLSDIIKE